MKFTPAIEAEIAATNAVVVEGYPWWLRPFLMGDVVAITLAHHIYLQPNPKRSEKALQQLLWHELAHVRQVDRHGFLRFLLRYGWDFARAFVRERNFNRAYRAIPFEVEAWAAESRADV
jgi:Domain of unknown function (DUF4157)